MRERLLKLINEADDICSKTMRCEGCIGFGKGAECINFIIADHLLANGVIAPPCKVGDTLYVISQMKDKRILPFVNEYEATYIQVGKRKCKVYHEKDGFIKIFLQDDFGKTVFLTREEAEAALKER